MEKLYKPAVLHTVIKCVAVFVYLMAAYSDKIYETVYLCNFPIIIYELPNLFLLTSSAYSLEV
jgi:hypothetical protein